MRKNDSIRHILSVIDVLTYLVLGISLIFFGITTVRGWGVRGILMTGAALVLFLLVAVAAGYVNVALFPERRMSPFPLLFLIVGAIFFVIITIAGVGLANNTALRGSVISFGEPGFVVSGINAAVQNILGGTSHSGVLIAVHLLCAIFACGATRCISSRVSALLVYAIMMLTPVQICCSLTGSDMVYASAFVMSSLWAFAASRRLARREESMALKALLLIVSPALAAVSASIYPAALVLPPAEVYYICALQKNREGVNPESKGVRILSSALVIIVFAAVFVLLTFARASSHGISFGAALGDSLSAFALQGRPGSGVSTVWGSEAYADGALFYHSAFMAQLVYGCVLMGALLCLIVSMGERSADILVFRAYLVACFLLTLLSGKGSDEHIAAFPVIAMMCALLYEEIYRFFRRDAFREQRAEREAAAETGIDEAEEAVEPEAAPDETVTEAAAADERVTDEPVSVPEDKAADDTAEYTAPVYDTETTAETGTDDMGGMDMTKEKETEAEQAFQSEDSEAEVKNRSADQWQVFTQDPLPDFDPLPGSAAKPEPESVEILEPITEPEPEHVETCEPVNIPEPVNVPEPEPVNIPEPEPAPDIFDEEGELKEGGVFTIDDIPGAGQGEETVEINDGSDGSFIDNPLPIPPPAEREELDFDFEIGDDEDFDI